MSTASGPASARTYCVYLHRAKGTVFYVGQGSPSRPFTQTQRSRRWHAFVRGGGGYQVDVVLWTTEKHAALTEEQRLIAALRPCCNGSVGIPQRLSLVSAGHVMTRAERIGQTIRRVRQRAGMSQAHLAACLGYKNATIVSRIERGTMVLSLENAQDIALHLGVTLADLVDDVPRNLEMARRYADPDLALYQPHFGHALKQCRKRLGWSQRRLALFVGYGHPGSISMIEHGRALPSLCRAMRLAVLFGESLLTLLRADAPLRSYAITEGEKDAG